MAPIDPRLYKLERTTVIHQLPRGRQSIFLSWGG